METQRRFISGARIISMQQFLAPWSPLSTLHPEKKNSIHVSSHTKAKEHHYVTASFSWVFTHKKSHDEERKNHMDFSYHRELFYKPFKMALPSLCCSHLCKITNHYIWWRKWDILRAVSTLNFYHKENLHKVIWHKSFCYYVALKKNVVGGVPTWY